MFDFLVFKYYGLDWVAMFFTFISIHRLGGKHRDGFIYGLAANICWAAFGILAMSIANPIANSIFLAMNLRGYRNWKRSTTEAA